MCKAQLRKWRAIKLGFLETSSHLEIGQASERIWAKTEDTSWKKLRGKKKTSKSTTKSFMQTASGLKEDGAWAGGRQRKMPRRVLLRERIFSEIL